MNRKKRSRFILAATLLVSLAIQVVISTLPLFGWADTDNGVTHMDQPSLSEEVEELQAPLEDLSMDAPEINAQPLGFINEIPVPERETLDVMAVGDPVRIRETDEYFETINAALQSARSDGLSNVTIEVSDDITETAYVNIDLDVTLVAVDGWHSVDFSPTSRFFRVQSGNTLVLGGGNEDDMLFINRTVSVTNGRVEINDGVSVYNNSGSAVELDGPNTSGTMSGGRLEGSVSGLRLINEAQFDAISSGVLTAGNVPLFLSGDGTLLKRISGGSFLQTDPAARQQGQALFIQNRAKVGTISGGFFEAYRSDGVALVRGGWIDEISGGEFTTHAFGYVGGSRWGALRVTAIDTVITGIGTISGGYFHGGNYGFVSNMANSYVGSITGGVYDSQIGIQNDVGSVIEEISGGIFSGNTGMFNVGTIDRLGGDVQITGLTSFGIYNYSGGTINEIYGGLIESKANFGILNDGRITSISGGTIIGLSTAVFSASGYLTRITGGTFWGRNNSAIYVGRALLLEPDLNSSIGEGRFWAGNGLIFDNENLVSYPFNTSLGEYYYMSDATDTLAVNGISAVEFQYLRLSNSDIPGTPGTPGVPGTDGSPDPGGVPRSGDSGSLLLIAILSSSLIIGCIGLFLHFKRRTARLNPIALISSFIKIFHRL